MSKPYDYTQTSSTLFLDQRAAHLAVAEAAAHMADHPSDEAGFKKLHAAFRHVAAIRKELRARARGAQLFSRGY